MNRLFLPLLATALVTGWSGPAPGGPKVSGHQGPAPTGTAKALGYQGSAGRESAQGDRQGARPASGLIAGRVTTAGTGAPVRGAQVTADFGVGPSPVLNEAAHRASVTDDDGRFELRDLLPGPWTVTASKTGYVTWQFGQRRPFETPAPLTVPEGGRRVTADINLPRGGAITGRVSDELAEPVSNVRVTVYRGRMGQGRRLLQAAGTPDHTDDTGAFRVYGLPPGDYYVAASLRAAPADSLVDTTYAPTYFPGTGNLGEAQRVRLELGAEVFADVQLLPVRRVRVSGVVSRSSGSAASAFLNLLSDAAELGVPLGLGGATLADGTFTLPDVAPGNYTLYATLRDGEPEEATEIRLTVGSEDVTGIALVTARAGTIRGTFSVEPPTRPVPQGIGVTARSSRSGGPMTAGQVSRGRFDLSAPTGPFRLDVHGLPERWTVKSILVEGIDATDAPIELGTGPDATARVVLTDRVTEISGTARSSGTARGHSVVVFPEDSALWMPPSRHVRRAAIDARGGFRLVGLPSGERYLAIAVDYLEEGEGSDPDFLARMAAAATRFSVAESETRTSDLAVVER